MTEAHSLLMKNVGTNIVTLLKTMRKDERLMKLLLSKKFKPFDDELITNDYIKEKTNILTNILAPFPFDEHAQTEEISQLRVYAMNTYLDNNSITSDTAYVFEIFVPKGLWLIWNEEGKETIRPYEISARIINIFEGLQIEGIGKLTFDGFTHVSVGTSFEGLRVYAKSWSVEKSGSTI